MTRKIDTPREATRRRHARRDEGSTLILVLVLIVVVSLIIVPLMSYAISVMRANRVVGDITERSEAVKGGLRYAMAEPMNVYATCGDHGPNSPAQLPSPGMSVPTTTTCYLLDTAAAAELEELPYSVATTFAGIAPPSGTGVIEPVYGGSGASDPNTWINDSTTTRTPDTVWLPNLPVHALSLRSATPFTMLPNYSLNGYTNCDVYFPGTYRTPLVISRPTYFVSGVYYFEKQITLAGGADVVTGLGTYEGCSDDQFSAFYTSTTPPVHNITGLGATFVFGDEGRIVVDDTTGPVSFRMNQRYVATTDTGGAPSAKVSMMTVNGSLDPALVDTNFAASGIDLVLPDGAANPRLQVPLSQVDSIEPRPAPKDSYRPSTLVPRPHPPTEPLAVTAEPHNGAVIVRWNAPESDGGTPITTYSVASTTGSSSCTTSGQRSCTIKGLSNNASLAFRVTATNEIGVSVPSAASTAVVVGGSALQAPAAPANVRIEQSTAAPVPNESRYVDTFVISWDPSTSDAPVQSYTVLITDLDPTSTNPQQRCDTLGETTCTITGLNAQDPTRLPTPYLAQYRIDVTATSAIGPSPAATVPQVGLAPATGESYVAPPVAPHPPYTPPPVVDVTLTSGNAVTFLVPGYISAPQGVVRVVLKAGASPENKSIGLDGGVLAGWIDLSANRPTEKFTVGLLNPATQRIIRIETRADDGSDAQSDAVVQINETGGWAVNSWVVQ